MKPIVSILMPVFNGERFLSEAIRSVRGQTFKNWELIIINDGSTDGTVTIIEMAKQEDPRINSFNKPHSGVVKSLNYGLGKASGEFIARIDSDDEWHPDKLEFQLSEFEKNKNLYLHGTSVVFVDEDGKPLADQRGFNNRKHLEYRQIKLLLLKNNLFCHSSVMFRRELLDLTGTYNEKFRNSEDYELWIRSAKRVVCEISDQLKVRYRVWPETVSLKRREEQIVYSLKARIPAILSLGNPLLNLFFMSRFLIISLIFLLRKNLKKLRQGIRA